jgi:tRNA-specific 2-thiouridylase
VTAVAGDRARVIFEQAQPAISPGQVVTVYQEDVVWGGGWIEEAIDA